MDAKVATKFFSCLSFPSRFCIPHVLLKLCGGLLPNSFSGSFNNTTRTLLWWDTSTDSIQSIHLNQQFVAPPYSLILLFFYKTKVGRVGLNIRTTDQTAKIFLLVHAVIDWFNNWIWCREMAKGREKREEGWIADGYPLPSYCVSSLPRMLLQLLMDGFHLLFHRPTVIGQNSSRGW